MAHSAFNWFDVVVVVVLALGIWSGRRTGALPQLIGFVHWTLVFLICAFLYSWPAAALAKAFHMQPDVMALIIYPLEVGLVYWLVGIKRRRLEKQMEKKELFGKGEYYAAMGIGIARNLIILLLAMSWLHGRYFTSDDLREYDKFCEENLGGIHLPTLCTTKDDVFNGSFTGHAAEKCLSPLLVAPAPRVQYAEAAVPAAQGGATPPKTLHLREAAYDDSNAQGAQLSDREGKERKAREAGAKPAAPAPIAEEIVYHHLTLRGISGTGDKKLALINNRALAKGESDVVKVDDRKVLIRVLQIRAQAVSIQVEDNPQPIDLELGQAAGLDGKVTAK